MMNVYLLGPLLKTSKGPVLLMVTYSSLARGPGFADRWCKAHVLVTVDAQSTPGLHVPSPTSAAQRGVVHPARQTAHQTRLPPATTAAPWRGRRQPRRAARRTQRGPHHRRSDRRQDGR